MQNDNFTSLNYVYAQKRGNFLPLFYIYATLFKSPFSGSTIIPPPSENSGIGLL